MLQSTPLPKRLVSAIASERWTPFVGAGFSKQSRPDRFPSWTELLSGMLTHFEDEVLLEPEHCRALRVMLASNQHLMVAGSIKERVPLADFQDYLIRMFRVEADQSSNAHRLLLELNPRCIITTNYDQLIEKAYARERNSTITRALFTQPGPVRNHLKDGSRFVFKIHGDIDSPSDLILTQEDYLRLEKIEEGYKLVLSAVFVYTTVLFLGYSLADPEMLHHLRRVRDALRHESHPHYAILPSEGMSAAQRSDFQREFGVYVITYRPDPNHSGLVETLKNLATAVKNHSYEGRD